MRVSPLVALRFMFIVAICIGACRVSALEPSPSTIKQEITTIMSTAPFGIERTTYHWRFLIDDDEPSTVEPGFLSSLSGTLGSLSKIILWSMAATIVVLIVLYRDRWAGLFSRDAVKPATRVPAPLFGHDETAERLPDDIAAAASLLWQQGDKRACLSLLYRGALLSLVTRHHLELPDSATEEDCLRLMVAQHRGARADYFAELTLCWQRIAYADMMPGDTLGHSLCETWREHFGVV